MMTAPDSEQRSTQRRTTLKGGKIVFNGGRSTIDCTVRNISETGAALDVQSPLGIPTEFTLVTETDSRPCRVVWRKEKRIGVRFG